MADTGKTIGLIKALASVNPEAIKSSVDDWLDDHPEATTTVEDGAITKAKLDSSLQQTVDDVGDLKSASGYVNANLLDNGYTTLGDDNGYYYLGKTTEESTGDVLGRMYYSSGNAAKRSIAVAIKPNTTYAVYKSTSTVVRIATGPDAAPAANAWLSSYAEHLSASNAPLYISSRQDDKYMYIQLFASSDAAALQTITANVGTLNIIAIADVSADAYDTIAKRAALTPYAFGAVNQVARIGWAPYAQYSPPQQSIASYTMALEHGVKIMLADVRVTEDGEFVCWHDANLSQYVRHTNGTVLSTAEKAQTIAELTLEELDVYDYGIYKGSKYAGTKILRLADFLEWCALTNCWAMLEIKVSMSEAQIISVCQMIKKYKLDHQIIVGEDHDLGNYAYWAENMPTCKYVVMGGARSWSTAVSQATAMRTAGIDDVYIGYSAPSDITQTMIDDITAIGVNLWYTEITSKTEFNSFYAAGYFNYYKLVSSSYIIIAEELYNKLM